MRSRGFYWRNAILSAAALLLCLAGASVRAATTHRRTRHHSAATAARAKKTRSSSSKASEAARTSHTPIRNARYSAREADASEVRAEGSSRRTRSSSLASSRTSTKKKSSRRRSSRNRSARVRHPEQTTPTPERMSEIQSALAKQGAYQGDPTGVMDSNTALAIKKFQELHSLPPTGKLDAPTLQKLGLGSDIAGKAAPLPVANSGNSAAPPTAAPAPASANP